MKQGIFEILSQDRIADNVFLLALAGDTSAITAPGQFVNLSLDGLYLRRPISVFDCEPEQLKLIYKVVGTGTAALSAYAPGRTLDVLTGLGNGYELARAGRRPLLIGGGAGVPPLYWLAKQLTAGGAEPIAVLGFNSARDVFCEAEFRALKGCEVRVVTVDGSYTAADGQALRGFVTDHLPDSYSYYYTCGPEPMLRAVYNIAAGAGEFSFEERMGCGFGACMGCSRATVTGYKRICKDGPVFRKEEILWKN